MSYNELVSIFDECFNYVLDFKSWKRKDFIKFVKDFMDNKTEYYKDEYFMKNYNNKVKRYIGC